MAPLRGLVARRIERARARWIRWNFDRAVRGVLDGAPLRPGRRDFTLLSMIRPQDLLPYLAAVKSFARYASPCEICVVADDPDDSLDAALLRRHIPFVRLVNAREVVSEGLPRGGTWERLACIAARVESGRYVVQLDSDTLTLAEPVDALSSIDAGRGFLLATANDQRIESIADFLPSARMRCAGNDHVQLLAENHLDVLHELGDFRYVRGCSGFTGFAPQSLSIDRLVEVSRRMSARIGERWWEWGTEQVTSNLFAATQPEALLLPHPKYCAAHWRDVDSVFLHFIGFVRFRDRYYERCVRKIVEELRRAES